MNEINEILFELAETAHRDYMRLPLAYVNGTVVNLETCTDLRQLVAAMDQLTAERDNLIEKIAKLDQLITELGKEAAAV